MKRMSEKEAQELAKELDKENKVYSWWLGASVDMVLGTYCVVAHVEKGTKSSEIPYLPRGVFIQFEMSADNTNKMTSSFGETSGNGGIKF